MSHMTIQTATDRRAAAAARQRLSRARRSQPRQPIECRCCGALWVPTRQGLYCTRQCVERAGTFRRRLQQSDQLGALAGWLNANHHGAAYRHHLERSDTGARLRVVTATGIGRAWAADTAERRRLLEGHRHLLHPLVEAELVERQWLMGPQISSGRYSSMAQVDPARAQELMWGCRW